MLRSGESGRAVSRTLGVNHRIVYEIRDAHGIPSWYADPNGPACRHGHPWPQYLAYESDRRKQYCRECNRLGKRRSYEPADVTYVDNLAIELVLRGERHRLTPLERRVAVRELLNSDDVPSGTEMADRIGCTPRTIWRIRKQLREAA